MPRFYFSVQGPETPDREGTELPSPRVAQVEAIRLSGAIIMERCRSINPGEDLVLEVADDKGALLFLTHFHVSEAPFIIDVRTHGPRD